MPRKTQRKVEKFPLTLHRKTGQWSKCFSLPSGQRRTVYFGKDRDKALAKYLAERDDWQAGRNPREAAPASPTAVSVRDLVNHFLSRSEERVELGEISAVTHADYVWVGERMADHFGRHRDVMSLTPTDFASFRASIAKKYAPSRLSKTIVVCRGIFKWGWESDLLPRPVKYGPDFAVASKRAARMHKVTTGQKLLTSEEIAALLQHADTTLRAMILLGINAGMGNSDVASLPASAVDLESGWITFPRPKTGVERRIPLWKEAVDALKIVFSARKPRQEFESLVFVTGRGGPWINVKPDGKRVDQIVEPFRQAAKAAGIHRPRMGFYWLRHSFQTIADDARDPVATASIMGHVDHSMAAHYRERIDDERLRKVTDHVRAWLFPKPKKPRKKKPAPAEKPQLRIVG